MRSLDRPRRIRGGGLGVLSPPLPECLADCHVAPAAGAKAPVAEVLHCRLVFEGTHLIKEMPEVAQVAYHYCKSMGGGDGLVAQCLLYDGTGPDARLIGVECLVGPATYEKMSAEEKAFWHDHS